MKQITTETFGNVLVAHTPDELTEETITPFKEALEQAMQSGHVSVVAQMDRSDLYDSVGLTTLLDLQDLLRTAGGNLKISGLEDPGRKIFEVTRLDQRFDIFDSVIDAVSSFQ
jgi:anti-sigma B factor antagonist